LVDSVSEKRRGAAFGLHRTLDQAGAIIGPLIASAAMIGFGFAFREIFWLSLIPGTIALFVLLFLVKERAGSSAGEFRLLDGIKSTLVGDFRWLLVVVGVFSLGAFNFSFVLLYAQQAGVADSVIPLVYALVNGVHVLVAIPAGLLADRFGKEKIMILGFCVFFVASVLQLLPVRFVAALLVAAVFGCYLVIVETIQRALIPQYVKPSLKGTAYGLYYLVVGCAFFVSNAVFGSLWDVFGSSVASVYSIVLSAVAIAAMVLFVKKTGKPVSEQI
jgi:MFS family permease